MDQVSFEVGDCWEDVELGFVKDCDGLGVRDVSWVAGVDFVAFAKRSHLVGFLIVGLFWWTFLDWRFGSEEV